jgi:phosphoribosylamine--glycine ligase
MRGEEASFIVMTDGDDFVEFPAAQDHKRVFDNDEGPNTGGMGAYAPAPIVTELLRDKIIKRIILPTLRGLKDEDRPYMGFLFAGLMIGDDGEPRLIEYNCRLGDPEAEVILPLLETDFVGLIEAALEKRLGETAIVVSDKSCVGVVLTSCDYPDHYEKGFLISGLEGLGNEDVMVFHSGTRKKAEGFVNDGGRVLVVSALADTLTSAIDKCYKNVAKIQWDGMHYRKDIGAKAMIRTGGKL